ncbi:MAG: hypothetical protein U5K30_17580 [Acidimicrobiales bacterium]|nr:hypothetical protein [Acidimicrobiales bacterium]
MTTVRNWWRSYWFEPVPAERMAVFSRIIHLVVLFTVFRTDRWVAQHAYAPEEYYQPVAIARILGLPAPDPGTMTLLQWVIGVSAVLAIIGPGGRAARSAINGVVACSYLTWILWAFSFAKVDHDRLTIIVTLFVLAAVPGVGRGRDALVGWGLRTVQVVFVLAYPLSAIAKLRRSGIEWVSSAVFARAVVRRGSALGDWLADQPSLLRAGQAAFITFEFAAVLALRRRGRVKVAMLVGIVLLHLFTYITVGIHFLAHTICITSFLPLERLHPRWRADRDERPSAGVESEGVGDERAVVGGVAPGA